MDALNPLDLKQTILEVSPDFRLYLLHMHYLRLIKRVVDGGCKRLIVNVPPCHHKTEFFAKILPAAFLWTRPSCHVGVCSYSAELADSFAAKALDYYQAWERRPAASNLSRAHFSTGSGGYWAAGLGGSVTGRAADLLVLEDLIKGPEQAADERFMEVAWDYYHHLRTRLLPGGALVVVCSRSGPRDLVGRILEEEQGAHWHSRENWTVVDLPALSERFRMYSRFPAHFTIDPDWREDSGEPLCPELYGWDALDQIRRSIGAKQWACQYQQRPS
jgi:hypothetical protein